MKTLYKYIQFDEIGAGRKTSVWCCMNNRSGHLLGMVRWYGPWRQYCFMPGYFATVFSAGCLDDISAFIGELHAERRAVRYEQPQSTRST